MRTLRRILLVKPSSMGDVIHALPVVSAIHARWPKAEIRWLIQPVWRSLAEGHPGVSGTILFPREKFRGPSGWLLSLGWLRTLRDWKPDLAIDLQGLLRSALFSRISGAGEVIGLSNAREGARLLIGRKAKVNPDDHAVRRNLAVLDLLGIPQPDRPEFLLPGGKVPEDFSTGTPFVVLHPFARGEGKSLTPAQIRAFIRGATPARVVVVGRGEALKDLPSHAEDWTNRTDLTGLIAILRSASFIVSTDSGPMHLAAALQPKRTLSIHLWSDPLKVGPCFPESMVWKNGRVVTVAGLDDSCRPEGRAPTEPEMEELGGRAAAESMKSEG
jgi:ADP-heptose:LPS heptosyltransferase